jgi:hypothetical protein
MPPPRLLRTGDSPPTPLPHPSRQPGWCVLRLQRRHSSQGMNVTPALPESGTATRCPSDKHHWPQEEVEAHTALGVTLLPGHQEGRCCVLLPAEPSSQAPWCWERSAGEEAVWHTDNLEMPPPQDPTPLHFKFNVVIYLGRGQNG